MPSHPTRRKPRLLGQPTPRGGVPVPPPRGYEKLTKMGLWDASSGNIDMGAWERMQQQFPALGGTPGPIQFGGPLQYRQRGTQQPGSPLSQPTGPKPPWAEVGIFGAGKPGIAPGMPIGPGMPPGFTPPGGQGQGGKWNPNDPWPGMRPLGGAQKPGPGFVWNERTGQWEAPGQTTPGAMPGIIPGPQPPVWPPGTIPGVTPLPVQNQPLIPGVVPMRPPGALIPGVAPPRTVPRIPGMPAGAGVTPAANAAQAAATPSAAGNLFGGMEFIQPQFYGMAPEGFQALERSLFEQQMAQLRPEFGAMGALSSSAFAQAGAQAAAEAQRARLGIEVSELGRKTGWERDIALEQWRLAEQARGRQQQGILAEQQQTLQREQLKQQFSGLALQLDARSQNELMDRYLSAVGGLEAAQAAIQQAQGRPIPGGGGGQPLPPGFGIPQPGQVGGGFEGGPAFGGLPGEHPRGAPAFQGWPSEGSVNTLSNLYNTIMTGPPPAGARYPSVSQEDFVRWLQMNPNVSRDAAQFMGEFVGLGSRGGQAHDQSQMRGRRMSEVDLVRWIKEEKPTKEIAREIALDAGFTERQFDAHWENALRSSTTIRRGNMVTSK